MGPGAWRSDTATALAFGRVGGVLSAFIGAAVITQGGPSSYLALLGGSMAAAGVALLLVRRHIPRVSPSAREASAGQDVMAP